MGPTFQDVQVDHSIQTIQRMYECGIDQHTAVCMYHIDQHTAIYMYHIYQTLSQHFGNSEQCIQQ